MQLEGKVVLVTGAARRLGREIAGALAERGARVAVHYGTSRDEAEDAAAALGGAAFGADLADHQAVVALPGRVRAEMGRLDGLVNSAALFLREPFAEARREDFDLQMGVNLAAPFFLSQAFVAQLEPEQEGRILNLSDARGEVMDATYPSYSLSKAGLLAMTRGLAVALAPRVRVFALVLGHMLPVVHAEDPARPPPPDSLLPGFAPEGTTGEAAAYLLGPGDFATGAVLHLDGGRHLKAPWGME